MAKNQLTASDLAGLVPKYFPGEEEAIATVCKLADKYGYGNLIHRLKCAWSKKLQDNHGMDPLMADVSALQICVWCCTDSRTGKKNKELVQRFKKQRPKK